MKIYTKVGDNGSTSLIGGKKISKSDLRIEAYGTVDELNSHMGVCLGLLKTSNLNFADFESEWIEIQNTLFVVGSQLACDSEKSRAQLPGLQKDAAQKLERSIDKMTDDLPPLKNFILPGGTLLASHLHVCRTICRRAERTVVRLCEKDAPSAYADLLIFLNRLSDYLFVCARAANKRANQQDVEWKK